MTTAALQADAKATPVALPNAIGLWSDSAFLIRVYGDEGGIADRYGLYETGEGAPAAPLPERAVTEADTARLDAFRQLLGVSSDRKLSTWTQWRDLAFEAEPGRRYVGAKLLRLDTQEPVVWARGAWLDPLLPTTQQEFLDYFTIATRRNVDPETAFLISRQIFGSWADSGEPPESDMAGYVINCFVVYLYKAVELERRPGDATFDKYRAYAFAAYEQLKEDGVGVRHDRAHVYASLQTVLWHWYIYDGDYEAAYVAASKVLEAYHAVVQEPQSLLPEGAPEIRFPVNRAFNYNISLLVLAVMQAAQKKSNAAIKTSRVMIDVFRRAVQTGTKNVTWYTELAIPHAAAAAAMHLADRIQTGTSPLNHGYLVGAIWNAPRTKTQNFKKHLSHMIRIQALRSGLFRPTSLPTLAKAVRGVVTPVPGQYRHGLIEADLRYFGATPDRIEVRFQRADGYERVTPPADCVEIDDTGRRLRLRLPVGPDTAPFSAVRLFIGAADDMMCEVDYDPDGWHLSSLFFFDARTFERGYFVRRKRGKDNQTLLYAAEQLADAYRCSITHRAVIAVVYAYRALEVWDRDRARSALENIDALMADPQLQAMPATQHIRLDPRHLHQSMLMARWQLAIALLDEAELLKSVTQAPLFGEGHVFPGLLHSFNAVRMSLIAVFLLRKYGRDDDAIASARAAERLFKRAEAREATHPNRRWGMKDFEIEETRQVVQRQMSWIDIWAAGGEVDDQQDASLLVATRLLGDKGRENLRHNFARLVGRIAKAKDNQPIEIPHLADLIEAERVRREAVEAQQPDPVIEDAAEDEPIHDHDADEPDTNASEPGAA